MIVKAISTIPSFNSVDEMLYKGRANTILPPGDDSDTTRLPDRYINPDVEVFNKTDRQVEPGDFCRVEENRAEGRFEIVEFIGREMV